jgi:hypothetical protein
MTQIAKSLKITPEAVWMNMMGIRQDASVITYLKGLDFPVDVHKAA